MHWFIVSWSQVNCPLCVFRVKVKARPTTVAGAPERPMTQLAGQDCASPLQSRQYKRGESPTDWKLFSDDCPTNPVPSNLLTMDREYLWRTSSDSSVSAYIPHVGFVASNRDLAPEDFQNPEIMARHVSNHLVWRNTEPTPFISTSSSKWYTLTQARRREAARENNVTIARIDHETQKEEGGGVRNVRDMVEDMGLQLTPEARQWLGRTEWLCQDHVPAKAIERVFTVEEFEQYCEQGESCTRLLFSFLTPSSGSRDSDRAFCSTSGYEF
jgi:hypothetical protein